MFFKSFDEVIGAKRNINKQNRLFSLKDPDFGGVAPKF